MKKMKDVLPCSKNESAIYVEVMKEKLLPDVARLHLEVFEEYMNARLGTAYVKAMLNWFYRTEDTIALVATDIDSNVIGYVIGAPVGYSKFISRDLFWAAFVSMAYRPWLFFDMRFLRATLARLKLFLGRSFDHQVEPDLPTPTMSLVSIGVSPSARRKKVGQCLVKAFEARSRRLEMRSLRLSVYPSNMSARRFYQRCGWQSFSGPLRETGEMYYYRVFAQEMG
jgi:ribosomal protein S18 acetylase RimI-like enzyme